MTRVQQIRESLNKYLNNLSKEDYTIVNGYINDLLVAQWDEAYDAGYRDGTMEPGEE